MAENVKEHGDGGENPVVTWHDPPPSGGVPRNVLGPKAFKAERWVEDEPEEILQNPEQDEESQNPSLNAPSEGCEAETEREVNHC